MQKISHTIRFEKAQKEKIMRLGSLQKRKFQSQVEYMLEEQLKNQAVFLFLNRVQCALESVSEEECSIMVAKIANIVNLELE